MKQQGELLIDIDGKYFFRVYKDNFEFTDYELRASDISIIIDDEFVQLKSEDGETGVLDYTDEVLGKGEE